MDRRATRGASALLMMFLAWGSSCASESTATPGVTPEDAAGDTANTAIEDAAPFPVRRLPCVASSALANDLPTAQMGALEGELVAIVPPGTKGCPADAEHLHLQVAVGDKRYDVAVTIDSAIGAPLAIHVHKGPVTPLAPAGWAAGTFDYAKDIGTPSADYQALSRDALLARLEAELSNASRVRVLGESYTDGSGVHKVHRNGRRGDGVIVVRHVDGADKAIALRFAGDVF